MLAALGRHPNRPAHLHFLVTAPGYQRIITHIFDGEDEWLSSDAVFGVKESLIAPFERAESGTDWRVNFDFVMVEA